MEAAARAGDGPMAPSETSASDVGGRGADVLLPPPDAMVHGEPLVKDDIDIPPSKSVEALEANQTQNRGEARRHKSFQERLEELKAYKAGHGHLNVKKGEDKSLHGFCCNVRSARSGKGQMKLTEDRIASLDALGFEWAPKMGRGGGWSSGAFERRLEGLKAHKADRGHLNVKESEDKSLADFCNGADKGEGKQRRVTKTFEARIEELKAYESNHGHINVKMSEDISLAQFCKNIRAARRGTGKMKLTKERIASLDALGFDWESRQKTFEERLEELKEYKAKHGHVKVKESEDKSLYQFCHNIRQARRGRRAMKLTDERLAFLVALGFDWEPCHRYNGVFDKKIFDMARRIKLAWEPQQNKKGKRQETVPARES